MPPKRRYSGTIGLCAADTGRFSEFSVAMARLDKPPDWDVIAAFNYDLAYARNSLVERFTGDYLWLMDDDQVFQEDVLKRLLAHELPIVGPLVLRRHPPFEPCPGIEGGKNLPLDQPPGLREVQYTGGAGLLIHRDVFDAIEPPWFNHGIGSEGIHFSDDAYFCHRAREAGFKIFCDTSVTLAHLAVAFITPGFDGKQWLRQVAIGDFRLRFQ